ncbi:hypothetical protein GLAREA_05889 [Glarea lozoyensis ATCC 20868]|uniref:Uncharacterized protein n=1 Tax=Glarea lozoyensis (strain ATCC 20868 / MF5171) TaxID=1116229 RepID=S3D309_GLAL2|nr:uncharacterized protein GLAREA_05889 [Glarea lozoyensis ATCC 20868]EPE32877.1 hypothetical protein GLAREA_05889 [Glarea lozoyensis ATCC 20868]
MSRPNERRSSTASNRGSKPKDPYAHGTTLARDGTYGTINVTRTETRGTRDTPSSSRRPSSPVVHGTKLNRDSRSSSTQQGSKIASPRAETMLNRDRRDSSSSARPSSSRPIPPASTVLHRDQSSSSRQPPQSSVIPPARTVLHRDQSSSSRHPPHTQINTPPARTVLHRDQQSQAPAPVQSNRQKTLLRTERDVAMASRMMNIQSMNPKERQEQEKWCQEQIKLSGSCPARFDWVRKKNGFHCKGGNHFITDKLLAMGNGFCYVTSEFSYDWLLLAGQCNDPRANQWSGPYKLTGGNFRPHQMQVQYCDGIPCGKQVQGHELGIEPITPAQWAELESRQHALRVHLAMHGNFEDRLHAEDWLAIFNHARSPSRMDRLEAAQAVAEMQAARQMQGLI